MTDKKLHFGQTINLFLDNKFTLFLHINYNDNIHCNLKLTQEIEEANSHITAVCK